MAKKNNTLGKFLAFTTAAAAIGSACYIYRDRIKESTIYKKTAGKLSNLYNKTTGKFAEEDDDFFFDDDFEDDFSDDVFSDDAKNNREYTSITINSKKTSPSEDAKETADNAPTVSDTSSPTVPFESKGTVTIDTEADLHTGSADVTAYENDNLSDTFEDPDTLEDQDKLDF